MTNEEILDIRRRALVEAAQIASDMRLLWRPADATAGDRMSEDIAAVCAKLGAIADHLEALDSESGEARTFRMCADYLKQQEDDIFRLRGVIMAEIAAEHRALDEWRENGGPDWTPSHPAMMRLQRLSEALR